MIKIPSVGPILKKYIGKEASSIMNKGNKRRQHPVLSYLIEGGPGSNLALGRLSQLKIQLPGPLHASSLSNQLLWAEVESIVRKAEKLSAGTAAKKSDGKKDAASGSDKKKNNNNKQEKAASASDEGAEKSEDGEEEQVKKEVVTIETLERNTPENELEFRRFHRIAMPRIAYANPSLKYEILFEQDVEEPCLTATDINGKEVVLKSKGNNASSWEGIIKFLEERFKTTEEEVEKQAARN